MRTDWRDEVNSSFRNFAKEPENQSGIRANVESRSSRIQSKSVTHYTMKNDVEIYKETNMQK